MIMFARALALLVALGLGVRLVGAEESARPKDGSCIYHPIKNRDEIVKLANGETYMDRPAKGSSGKVPEPILFLCKDGHVKKAN